jgi:two-component system, chemotaxis family, protein-glutamate methylesterase/glutaminase
MASAKKIRVVVVDDSMFMRAVVAKLLRRDGRFEVVGEAKHGREAVDAAADLRPDVMTMDVNMPVMGGVDAVREIMRHAPVPVVMLSAHTSRGATATVEALAAGAVDFISKPSGEVSADISLVGEELVSKLLMASDARPRQVTPPRRAAPKGRLPAVTWSPEGPRVVVIGISTGGPAALSRVIPALPGELDCCLLVVQHMPREFTAALASRLDQASALAVREARDGDRLHQGQVLLAPGDRHLVVESVGSLRLTDEPPVNNCRPSVDVTMRSAARVLGRKTTGVLMTGMGRDGAEGLRAIREAGGQTLCQDERSCVIFGMPRAAIELGVVDRVIALEAIPAAIQNRWTP